MAIRAFIFDLDGILTDSAEYHFLAWKRLAEEEGLPFSRADNEALRGLSRRESLNLLLKGRPIEEKQAHDWMERKNVYYLEMIRGMTEAEVLPGVGRLLAELRAAGLKIAVASASRNAKEVIERLSLSESIDVLCDGNKVLHAKPAPDLFLVAAEELGVLPRQCVVVEDAAVGIEAARDAGMPVIGVGPAERVGEADIVLPDLADARLSELLIALEGRKKRSE